MIDIDITITNTDGSLIKPVLMDLPGYDEFLDRPRRLQVKIEKGSGLDPQGTAKVSRKGKIILLGHITKFDQSKADSDRLTIDSAEYLLDQRITQFYRYPAGTTLNAMLSASLGGSVVGLLAMANSLVPRGSFVLHSGYVYQWVGMGTASRLGTISSLYQNTSLLSKVTSIPTTAGKWYQSATDLYVWTTDNKDPKYHLILIPNFKDTLVRLGTISLGTSTFPVCFEIGVSKLFPTIKALILSAGLEWNLRSEKDNLVYLDASATIGRGSSAEPVATYIDGQNAEISTGQADGPWGKIQALLGQGAGSGLTQQCAAACDITTLGTWRENIYQVGGLFGAMLRTATEKVFSDAQDPTIYNVRTIDQDWNQGIGNYVGIVRDGYQPVVRRIKHIQMRSSGDMFLEVGQRLRTTQELLRGDQEVQQILSSFYGAHSPNAWSWTFNDINIDSYISRTVEFELKNSEDNGEIDTNFPYQVLLNLKIGWYKANTNKASNPTKSHGGVGSHGGYGGGSTSSKPMTAHGVPQTETTGASGSGVAFMTVGYANHVHGISHSHGVSVGGAWYYTYNGDDRAWGPSGTGSTNSQTGTTSGYGGSAVSSYGTPLSHVHPLPAHYTQEAASQSHDTQHEGAQTRAGSSAHPEWDATLDGLLKEYGTGYSIHYLTVSVKVNGVHAPGSPFSGAGGTGIYIGDALDNIDISNLVTVGGKNVITLQVTEFGGSGPVRCALSGGVNVNAIISTF